MWAFVVRRTWLAVLLWKTMRATSQGFFVPESNCVYSDSDPDA